MSDSPADAPGANRSDTAPATRSVDLSVSIDASAEAVWKAISDGEELTRWFPPIATVEPGPGGHVTVSWGGDAEWTSTVVTWEPGRHLRLEDRMPDSDGDDGPVVALDYHIDAQGESTVLRLVNSGFSAADDWDDFYHMTENGWRFFLWNLKHYLERHPGTPRTMMSVRPWVSGSREEVWDTLFGPGGFGTAPGEAGDPFTYALDGASLEGHAVLSDRPWAFAGVVSSLDDGVLHVEMEGSGDRWKMGVWLSAYGVDQERCTRFSKALETTLARLFPDPS